VLIDGAFACVYWTGACWQIPVGTKVRPMRSLPAKADIGPRLQWNEEWTEPGA
jgi:hypothetical protein